MGRLTSIGVRTNAVVAVEDSTVGGDATRSKTFSSSIRNNIGDEDEDEDEDPDG
jgi:hypothetical protein